MIAEIGEFPAAAAVDNVSARFITLFPRAVHYFFFSLSFLSRPNMKDIELVSTMTSRDRPDKCDYREIKESALVPLSSCVPFGLSDSPQGLDTEKGSTGARNSAVTHG